MEISIVMVGEGKVKLERGSKIFGNGREKLEEEEGR